MSLILIFFLVCRLCRSYFLRKLQPQSSKCSEATDVNIGRIAAWVKQNQCFIQGEPCELVTVWWWALALADRTVLAWLIVCVCRLHLPFRTTHFYHKANVETLVFIAFKPKLNICPFLCARLPLTFDHLILYNKSPTFSSARSVRSLSASVQWVIRAIARDRRRTLTYYSKKVSQDCEVYLLAIDRYPEYFPK